ncbi:MAG: ribonuclease III [Oscillospiraceae bacterium]|jgi:ribonuclease-3 family protein|nr:ribonuclease III [Oscillospiraceae bacterium]
MDLSQRKLTDSEINALSALALAHVGDAVYELFARTRIAERGKLKAKDFHRETVKLVSAQAQSKAAELVFPSFTGDERAVYSRGRNAHSRTPGSASSAEYHAATALETLFGYLYLSGNIERASELFELCAEVRDAV